MKPNNKGFTGVEIVLVIVTVAALSFAGWTWWQGWQVEQSVSSTPVQTEETTQQGEKTDKNVPENWTEYSSKEYGFRFAYPEKWGDVTREEKVVTNYTSPVYENENSKDIREVQLTVEEDSSTSPLRLVVAVAKKENFILTSLSCGGTVTHRDNKIVIFDSCADEIVDSSPKTDTFNGNEFVYNSVGDAGAIGSTYSGILDANHIILVNISQQGPDASGDLVDSKLDEIMETLVIVN